jgi:hypothetical protein
MNGIMRMMFEKNAKGIVSLSFQQAFVSVLIAVPL